MIHKFENFVWTNLLRAIVGGIHSGYNDSRVRSSYSLGSPLNIVRLRDALIERDIIYSEMKQLYITDHRQRLSCSGKERTGHPGMETGGIEFSNSLIREDNSIL